MPLPVTNSPVRERAFPELVRDCGMTGMNASRARASVARDTLRVGV